MPIIVKQTPVGVLGRLAVMAGQARGRQLQAARDIQFTSMALAAQDRAAQIGLAAQDRAFALQRAGAAQIARQRPVAPDVRTRRRELQRFVSEAKTAGIYDPRQIKQAELFAKVGDPRAMEILGKLPKLPAKMKPSPRRRELGEQAKEVVKLRNRAFAAWQQQFDALNEQLGKRFDPSAREFHTEHLEHTEKYMDPKDQKLFARRRQMIEELETIHQQAEDTGRLIALGMSYPEQIALKVRQEALAAGQEEKDLRRLERQARGIGGLSEQEELAVDLLRDKEKDTRTRITREITRLQKDLVQFEDEDDDDYAERARLIQGQITVLGLQRTASYGTESKNIAKFLKGRGKAGGQIAAGRRFVKNKIYTNAAGRRARFTGYDDTGRPMMELVE